MPKVRVPQETGEIVIASGGDPPKTYKVSDHQVAVAEENLPLFLRVVEGAERVSNKTAKDT